MSARGEQKTADAITALDGGPGNGRRQLAGSHRLEPSPGTEKQAGAGIEHDQHRPLALFLEHLGMSPAGARRDAPVHIADIVTGLVIS